MGCLVNSIVVLVLTPFFFALFEGGLLALRKIPDWSTFRWLALGMVAYLPVHLFSRNLIPLLGTLEHELCHAAAKYASLGWVSLVRATPREGGETQGEPRYFMVSLAPYYLPLFTLLLLPIRLLVTPAGQPVIDILLGLTLAFHYTKVLTTALGAWQSDFDKAGPVALLMVTPSLNVFFLVLIASGIISDYGLILDYLRGVVAATPEYYRTALAWLQQAAGQLLAQVE